MASLNAITSYACQGKQGIISVSGISDAPGAPEGGEYSWSVVAASTGMDYGGPVGGSASVKVPDDSFEVRVYALYPNSSTGASTPRTYVVDCSDNQTLPTCDLRVISLVPTPATTIGGYGYASLRYATASASKVQWGVVGPEIRSQVYDVTNDQSGVLYLLAGNYEYTLSLVDDPGCKVTGTFEIHQPEETQLPDPSLSDKARWEPVGGVLPNPILLKVEATLTDAAGARRPGLHVEVELWRPAAALAFATFRATVREAPQYVDAAPYLRAELVAAQRYPVSSGSPFIDADAALRFYYRYRVVDKAGAEPWLTRAGERYAVLAALPEATDTMAPYVADGTGQVASVFPDYEGVQFVGMPLEASVLLPPAGDAPRWAELRYLDANRQEIEIRSFALAATLPAGMLRIPLPVDVLPCAAFVEVSIRDDNRAYQGNCNGITNPGAGSGGYLLANNGRLRL
jgi:hypothetical protein